MSRRCRGQICGSWHGFEQKSSSESTGQSGSRVRVVLDYLPRHWSGLATNTVCRAGLKGSLEGGEESPAKKGQRSTSFFLSFLSSSLML